MDVSAAIRIEAQPRRETAMNNKPDAFNTSLEEQTQVDQMHDVERLKNELFFSNQRDDRIIHELRRQLESARANEIVLQMIEEVLSEPTASIEIFAEQLLNERGKCCIRLHGNWIRWNGARFFGDSLEQALEKSLEARDQWKKQTATTTNLNQGSPHD